MHTHSLALFDTAGPIAEKERNLIYFALALSLLVVVPVFTMLIIITWKYREGNKRAKYSPELDGNAKAETIWWGLPTLLILILSIVTWNSSHALDPFKPLDSKRAPLQVQVVSLDWKWLFIYPQQHIATVNELHVPTGVPVNFQLTSDTVMNSFWIPRLGGQIYTMPGMITELHLQANKNGVYEGQSANISGRGFAGMHFNTVATAPQEFDDWVQSVQVSKGELDTTTYATLAQPSSNVPVQRFRLADSTIFDGIMERYMGTTHTHMEAMQ